MFYLWFYLDGGSGWTGLGWFPFAWDNSRKAWSNVIPTLQSQIPNSSAGWWEIYDNFSGKIREGRHEVGGEILEYQLE